MKTKMLADDREEVEFILQKLREIFANDASGHDYWHTLRVYRNAMEIEKTETCNEGIVKISALLHDVDDAKLFDTDNYANARKIMAELNLDAQTTEEIISVISQVSFKGTDSVTPNTIEGKIVQDADRLDALGAIGIARAFAYGGSKGRCMHDPDRKPLENITEETYKNNAGTTINHFYEKLFLLKDLMNTDTGKRMACERDSYMHGFLEEFMCEWDGMR